MNSRPEIALGSAPSFDVGTFLSSMEGPFRSLARRLPIRGTCQVEDLLQAARLKILMRTRCGHYDTTRLSFVHLVLRDARAAMVEEIGRQKADVHQSRESRIRCNARVDELVVSVDVVRVTAAVARSSEEDVPFEPELSLLGGGEQYRHASPHEALEKDQLIELVKRGLDGLEEKQRLVIQMYFGIGREAMSSAKVQRTLKIGQTRFYSLLRSGLSRLRALDRTA